MIFMEQIKKINCMSGQHVTGRDKQWVIDGKVVMGAYCQICGQFVPKKG